MTAKHTSGEWFIEEPKNPDMRQIDDRLICSDVNGERLHIAEVYQYQNDNHRGANGTAIANARLIRTAPTLLMALKGVVGIIPHSEECIKSLDIPKNKRVSYRTKNKIQCPCCDRFQIARTAIAKAEHE